MSDVDLLRTGSIDPGDITAAILELDERLKRVEAFMEAVDNPDPEAACEAFAKVEWTRKESP